MDLHQPLVGDGQGHPPDGAHLGQHLLPHGAIAAGGGVDQLAIVVGEVDGQPVILVLHPVGEGRQAWRFLPGSLHPGKPLAQPFLGLHLVQAPQRGQMPVLLEGAQRFAADAAAGRIGQHNARLLLHLLKAGVQRVPLRIGHHRLILHIVAV